MKIGIMGWDHEEYESKQLDEIAKELGYDSLLFSLQDVKMTVINNDFKLTVFNVDLKEFDTIISRAQIRPEYHQQDLELLKSIQEYTDCINENFDNYYMSESKMITQKLLTKCGVNVPDTFLVHSVEEIKNLWLTYKNIVIKPSFGYGGTDVERINEDFESYLPIVENLLSKYKNLLVQQYIPHPDGDIRVTTMGNEVFYAFRRIPNEKTWKANVAMGANIEVVKDYTLLKEIALKASNAIGLSLSGVDIIEYNNQFYVFEVNNCPGWYPLSVEEGREICKEIIEYSINLAKGRLVLK